MTLVVWVPGLHKILQEVCEKLLHTSQEQVEHTIFVQGFDIHLAKIQAIQEWPMPKAIKNLFMPWVKEASQLDTWIIVFI